MSISLCLNIVTVSVLSCGLMIYGWFYAGVDLYYYGIVLLVNLLIVLVELLRYQKLYLITNLFGPLKGCLVWFYRYEFMLNSSLTLSL